MVFAYTKASFNRFGLASTPGRIGLLDQLSADGVAVLMATHDLFRAKEAASRVGIMKHGRLVATLGTSEIGHADLERIYLEHVHA